MLLVDRIARRYNRTPGEVLDMDPYDLSLCVVCVQHADAHQANQVKKLQRHSKGSMVPAPVPVLNIGDI